MHRKPRDTGHLSHKLPPAPDLFPSSTKGITISGWLLMLKYFAKKVKENFRAVADVFFFFSFFSNSLYLISHQSFKTPSLPLPFLTPSASSVCAHLLDLGKGETASPMAHSLSGLIPPYPVCPLPPTTAPCFLNITFPILLFHSKTFSELLLHSSLHQNLWTVRTASFHLWIFIFIVFTLVFSNVLDTK